MLFAESCCDRGFDIFMDEEEVVTDLVVQKEQGGINVQDTGVFYTREFVAGDAELNILLGGSVGVPDNNPILNALTLEKIEGIVSIVGDCNGDGSLTAEDLACVANIPERDAVLAALNTLPGDLDGVGGVAFPDFLVLAENFGNEGGYNIGNVDLVGGVAFPDFLILAENFGKTVGQASSVPEPSGAALASLAILALGFLRRRR